ncbi:DUF647-domain-containing protein [Massarina eburnea CBS 473.64]|uniref:DUF647-domain-containing protein n=1 Tax=Massarina eburnea CBS 473.64 TaxID=1395130 RepID=A0A6A6S4C5_9PLEO|nr:DUF647-domain-containing protein [Massarina eburnea CBS 473.64]
MTRERTRTASNAMKKATNLQLAEYDRSGNLKARYVESRSNTSNVTTSRIDILHPTSRKRLWRNVLDVFLPDGYPNSVSDDYTAYQIFDSFQAFAGTIAGMISSRAVWEGLGVGDSRASPTGAMLIQVIRECMGKLGTIFFAHFIGTSIEAECKAYRLGADVMTDAAMILDCASPWVPSEVRFLVLCCSSIMFSAAGVAGGASKSSLSGHFAKWNNLGELNAKDGSQETVISLMGMLAGTLVVSWLTTSFLTWSALLALLGLHLFLNWLGVRAVKMNSLNRQRANIAFSKLVEDDKVLSPAEVSDREIIFEKRRGSVLRWNGESILGHCRFGVSIKTLLASLAKEKLNETTGSMSLEEVSLSELTHLFRNEQYLLWYRILPSTELQVLVVLKDGIDARGQLRAWYHGLLLARRLRAPSHTASTLENTRMTFDGYAKRLTEAEWDLNIPVMETSSGLRVKTGEEA